MNESREPSVPGVESADEDPLQKSFEEQWSHPQELVFGKEKLRIYDLVPDAAEAKRFRQNKKSAPAAGAEAKNDSAIEKKNREDWQEQKESLLEKLNLPIMFCPGWIQNSESQKRNLRTMYKEGCRMILPDSLHGIPTKELEKNGSTKGMAKAELRKAAMLLATLNERSVDQVDAIAHSEGAINLVMAALLAPERFRNIVLIDPAGMIGKDNLIGLAVRSQRENTQLAQARKAGAKFEYDFEGVSDDPYFKGTPIKTLKEVIAIANSNIQGMLAALRAKGIGVTVINGAEDLQFPTAKMQRATGIENVRGFVSVKGAHHAFFQQPSIYSGPVLHQLAALANRKAISQP
jgi:pimeloyl-ACP methyl ester carboxylesterase